MTEAESWAVKVPLLGPIVNSELRLGSGRFCP